MRLEAARFDCWMMSSTLSSNRSHDGGGSPGDQMSGRCATVIEREKMKASIMELCSTSRTLRTLRRAPTFYAALRGANLLYAALRGANLLYAALREANLLYAALRIYTKLYAAVHSFTQQNTFYATVHALRSSTRFTHP